jgi:hypothetical protein
MFKGYAHEVWFGAKHLHVAHGSSKRRGRLLAALGWDLIETT